VSELTWLVSECNAIWQPIFLCHIGLNLGKAQLPRSFLVSQSVSELVKKEILSNWEGFYRFRRDLSLSCLVVTYV